MKSGQLKLVDPAVMCSVERRRKPYDGQRQDLTRDEIDKLFAALKRNRNGHRDYMIGLVCFLHGLRVSELIDLRWDDIDWRALKECLARATIKARASSSVKVSWNS